MPPMCPTLQSLPIIEQFGLVSVACSGRDRIIHLVLFAARCPANTIPSISRAVINGSHSGSAEALGNRRMFVINDQCSGSVASKITLSTKAERKTRAVVYGKGNTRSARNKLHTYARYFDSSLYRKAGLPADQHAIQGLGKPIPACRNYILWLAYT